MSKVHEVKCIPANFKAIREGRRSFDVRRDDRGFKAGDQLWLHEFNPVLGEETGDSHIVDIDHVLHAGEFGLEGIQEGHVVLGISQ